MAIYIANDKSKAKEELSPRFVKKYLNKFKNNPQRFLQKLEYRLTRLARLLNRHDFENLRILDAGAGFGLNSLMLALAGAKQVVAVDILPNRIRDLSKLSKVAVIEDCIIPVCGDYSDAMEKHEPFDLIIGTCFLSHINNLETFFEMSHKHLETAGQLYIMDDNNALSLSRQISVRKEWWAAEFSGDRKRCKGYFLEQRRKVANDCLDHTPHYSRWLIREWCAWASRGMTSQETEEYCHWFLDRNHPRPPRPSCSYRDPITGVPEERLLNPLRMATTLKNTGFDVTLFPSTSINNSIKWKRRKELITKFFNRTFEVVAVRKN